MRETSILEKRRRFPATCGLAAAILTLLLASGCVTTDGPSGNHGSDGSSSGQVDKPKPADQQEQTAQIARLELREKTLQRQIRLLDSKLKAEKVARESLARRFEVAQAAREDAIREVVRIRARIQGMASQAEASAMFAEARVILDRMEEEAYSAQALEDLGLARSYMADGKEALDTGNSGGAAYLFDLIPGVFEGMKKADPRTVKVNVSVATLRESPVSTSRKIDSLNWGDKAEGTEKSGDWFKIRTSSGLTGWLMKSQVQ